MVYSPARGKVDRLETMDNDIVKRLIWTGLLAATGALASVAAHALSAIVWRRLFDEDPPE